MRPLLTRAARERCEHPKSVSIRSTLPDSYDGRQWCAACGVFWIVWWNAEDVEHTDDALAIDWPATDRADREQMERDGQGRLPL